MTSLKKNPASVTALNRVQNEYNNILKQHTKNHFEAQPFASKNGRKFVKTKSPNQTFTAAKEREIISKCNNLLKEQPIKDAKQIKCNPLPPLERLKQLFDYNAHTGEIKHKLSRGGMSAGDLAGTIANGYTTIYVDYSPFRAHRLAWKLHYGKDPKGILDHINGNRSDNCITNLREATALINAQNKNVCHSNTGVIGVSYCSATKRYLACIGWNVRTVHLGSYVYLNCANAARKCAESILFKFPEIVEAA